MLGWNEFVKKPPLRRPHAGLILPTVTSAMTPSTLQPMYSFDVLVIDARDALHNSRHARSSPKRDDLPANSAPRVPKAHASGLVGKAPVLGRTPSGAWFCGRSTSLQNQARRQPCLGFC